MTTAVRAIYDNGVFKPKEPVKLREKTEVEVLIPTETSTERDDPTGWKAARRFIGLWKDAPDDNLADAHDDHLYE